MLKTAILNYEYFENKATVCETFGLNDDAASTIRGIGKTIIESDDDSVTASMIAALESGKITGSELMCLAALKAVELYHLEVGIRKQTEAKRIIEKALDLLLPEDDDEDGE